VRGSLVPDRGGGRRRDTPDLAQVFAVPQFVVARALVWLIAVASRGFNPLPATATASQPAVDSQRIPRPASGGPRVGDGNTCELANVAPLARLERAACGLGIGPDRFTRTGPVTFGLLRTCGRVGLSIMFFRRDPGPRQVRGALLLMPSDAPVPRRLKRIILVKEASRLMNQLTRGTAQTSFEMGEQAPEVQEVRCTITNHLVGDIGGTNRHVPRLGGLKHRRTSSPRWHIAAGGT
jgi:hypothetical protein